MGIGTGMAPEAAAALRRSSITTRAVPEPEGTATGGVQPPGWLAAGPRYGFLAPETPVDLHKQLRAPGGGGGSHRPASPSFSTTGCWAPFPRDSAGKALAPELTRLLAAAGHPLETDAADRPFYSGRRPPPSPSPPSLPSYSKGFLWIGSGQVRTRQDRAPVSPREVSTVPAPALPPHLRRQYSFDCATAGPPLGHRRMPGWSTHLLPCRILFVFVALVSLVYFVSCIILNV